MNGLDKLYLGDFNNVSYEKLPGNVTNILLYQRGFSVMYRFQVKDLYGEHEVLLSHEVIPIKRPKWIIDRMEAARKHARKDKG